MISGSGYADALIASFVSKSASIFSSSSSNGNLTKNDFGILDTTTSGSVYVVLPGGFDAEIGTFGDRQLPQFRLTVRAYVRDTGNSVETLNHVWQADKDIRATVQADDTLGGYALLAVVVRGSGWNGDTFIGTQGGQVWIPQDFTIRCEQIG